MRFGTKVSSIKNMIFVGKEKDKFPYSNEQCSGKVFVPFEVYKIPDDNLSVGSVEFDSLSYGFYDEKLFKVTLKKDGYTSSYISDMRKSIKYAEDMDYLYKVFSSKYGEVKSSSGYHWKVNDLKISILPITVSYKTSDKWYGVAVIKVGYIVRYEWAFVEKLIKKEAESLKKNAINKCIMEQEKQKQKLEVEKALKDI